MEHVWHFWTILMRGWRLWAQECNKRTGEQDLLTLIRCDMPFSNGEQIRKLQQVKHIIKSDEINALSHYQDIQQCCQQQGLTAELDNFWPWCRSLLNKSINVNVISMGLLETCTPWFWKCLRCGLAILSVSNTVIQWFYSCLNNKEKLETWRRFCFVLLMCHSF